MSKKLLSKKWLDLKEASQLLEAKIKEKCTVKDILSFVCEGKLDVYWYLHRVYAREVALQSVFHDDRFIATEEELIDFVPGVLEEYCSVDIIVRRDKCAQLPIGYYKVNVLGNEDIYSFFKSILIDNVEFPHSGCETYHVDDSNGGHWRLMEYGELYPWQFDENRMINKIAAIANEELRSKEKEKAISEYINFHSMFGNSSSEKREKTQSFIEKVQSISLGDFVEEGMSIQEFIFSSRVPNLTEIFVKTTNLEVLAVSILNGESAVAVEPAPKTKNAYLRLIRSLVDIVIEGSTGESSKDAQACLAALSKKGISHPIGERALINYLDEADKLG